MRQNIYFYNNFTTDKEYVAKNSIARITDELMILKLAIKSPNSYSRSYAVERIDDELLLL
jgi:hypothetical protein